MRVPRLVGSLLLGSLLVGAAGCAGNVASHETTPANAPAASRACAAAPSRSASLGFAGYLTPVPDGFEVAGAVAGRGVWLQNHGKANIIIKQSDDTAPADDAGCAALAQSAVTSFMAILTQQQVSFVLDRVRTIDPGAGRVGGCLVDARLVGDQGDGLYMSAVLRYEPGSVAVICQMIRTDAASRAACEQVVAGIHPAAK